MLFDIPMSDISFSGEQHSPAPASASLGGVRADGVSFSLVLDASAGVLPQTVSTLAPQDQSAPVQDPLPTASLVTGSEVLPAARQVVAVGEAPAPARIASLIAPPSAAPDTPEATAPNTPAPATLSALPAAALAQPMGPSSAPASGTEARPVALPAISPAAAPIVSSDPVEESSLRPIPMRGDTGPMRSIAAPETFAPKTTGPETALSTQASPKQAALKQVTPSGTDLPQLQQELPDHGKAVPLSPTQSPIIVSQLQSGLRKMGPQPAKTIPLPKPAVQSPTVSALQPSNQPPKIAVDPNALALPVETPVFTPAASTSGPPPAVGTVQSLTPAAMPIGTPPVDVSQPSQSSQASTVPQVRDAQPLERLVETISQMRESGQTARGEVSLRHNQFGLVSMQVQSSDGELQARLASRDPAFVAAAQLALADRALSERALSERAMVVAGDTAQTGARGNEGQNQGRDMGQMSHNDGRGSGAASGDQKSGNHKSDQTSTKGEHGAALSSADDHIAPKDTSITQATNGLFA